MYTIRLRDGTVLDGLEVRGGIFLSTKEVDAAKLRGNLAGVRIEGPAPEEGSEDVRGEFELMELGAKWKLDGKDAFVLHEVPSERVEYLRLRADADYLLMVQEEEA